MHLDVRQLKENGSALLHRGLDEARLLPRWVWAIPAALFAGFAWAIAFCWQPTPKDEASVTMRELPRRVASQSEVAGDRSTYGADYIPPSARERPRRTRRRRKPKSVTQEARVAPKEEPQASPIGPEAHWMETVAAPAEVGALKRRPEKSAEASGGGSGETSGGAGGASSGDSQNQ